MYENASVFPCEEDAPCPAPDLVYAVSKKQCEDLIRCYRAPYPGFEVCILRFFNVYGPHQDFRRKHPPLIGYLLKELLAGNAPVLHSSGHQRRDYVYVDDVTAMCELAMTHPCAPHNTFNVASGA